MEILQIIVILSGLSISLGAAFISILSTKKRIELEKELNRELRIYIDSHFEIIKILDSAKSKEDIDIEIKKNLYIYESLINDVSSEMSDEKRSRIYNALNQKSEKGKLSYILKTFHKSLAEV